jgi:TfoX/Sxy family transcriptional regulator of competence genes
MKSLGGNGIFVREVWFEESSRSRFRLKSEKRSALKIKIAPSQKILMAQF